VTSKIRSSSIGTDGIITLVFSTTIIVITFGISLLWFFLKVILLAKNSYTKPENNKFKYILLLGIKLNNNQINEDFITRLERAHKLYHSRKTQQKIIVLGGVTHKNSMSEAEAGFNYLVDKKVNQHDIIIEDLSQHTLENLRNARKLITSNSSIIISNRYHLYRAKCIAEGLNLTIQPIAAEDKFNLSIKLLFLYIKEAYFVHWYFSGKLWVFITRNKVSYSRIS
jgi:uncharacterized SAM-binding protein YcdF (DUF218 family)